MDLDEFVLQPRGPYLFDHYTHPDRVGSPLGDFTLELHVDDANVRGPDERMLAAIASLRDAFVQHIDSLVELVFEQYQLATADYDDDPEWFDDMEIPIGLTKSELEPLLGVRTLAVSRDSTGVVYMSPEWDCEHGLSFARQNDSWIQVDC